MTFRIKLGKPQMYPSDLLRAAEGGNPHAARLMARLYVKWSRDGAALARMAARRTDHWAADDAAEDAKFARRYAQRVARMRRLNPAIPGRWSRIAYAHAARAAKSARLALNKA